jgi:hydroxymethylpyrimidine/phosphomethylpyrimidine kinase
MSAITAVVDENTVEVTGVHALPESFVQGQIRSVLNDIGADAVKIGMLHSSSLICAVKEALTPYRIRDIVIDPVMVATSGDRLLQDEAVHTLKNELLLMARVITPNLPEAETLLGNVITPSTFVQAAKELSFNRRVSVLLKAGHLTANILTDIFYNAENDEVIELSVPRIDTCNTHGTGCTLSSAIASFLAHKLPLNDAVKRAKDYIQGAITHGAFYKTGKGHGPVHHFFPFWE